MSNPSRGFLALFVKSSPIKFPPPKPQFRLHLRRKNQTLDATNSILPRPHPSSSAASAPSSFPTLTERLGELARSFSTFRCFRFGFWCSETRSGRGRRALRRRKWRTTASESRAPAGRRRGVPGGVLGRRSRNQAPGLEDTPSGSLLFKSPWGFPLSTRDPWRIPLNTFSPLESVFFCRPCSNTFCRNYRIATDFIMLIKYSF